MVKLKLNKVGVLKFGLFSAIYSFVSGLLTGILLQVFSSNIDSLINFIVSTPTTLNFGWISILVLPLLYAIFGFVGGMIVALIFNLILKIIKGFDVDLEEVEETKNSQVEVQKNQPQKNVAISNPR